MERTVTTILIMPISLGVILLSEGILGFYGSQGWFNQIFLTLGITKEPFILTHNYAGVMLALFMQQFPFCFLMLLDDIRHRSEPRTLGAHVRRDAFDRVPARDAAAHRTRSRHRICIGVRHEFCGVSVGHHARAAGGHHTHDLYCRLSEGLRAI